LHRCGKGIEGQSERWNSAAVETKGKPIGVNSGVAGNRVRYDLLNRVVTFDVAGGIMSKMLGDGEKAGVLARTAIMDWFEGLAGTQEFISAILRKRSTGPTFQSIGFEPDAMEPGSHSGEMFWFGAMACRCQRDLIVGYVESVSGTGLQQRQHLERFDGRSRKDRTLEVSRLENEPVWPHNHRVNKVFALYKTARHRRRNWGCGHLHTFSLDEKQPIKRSLRTDNPFSGAIPFV